MNFGGTIHSAYENVFLLFSHKELGTPSKFLCFITCSGVYIQEHERESSNQVLPRIRQFISMVVLTL